jgi:hypothetical protein
MTDKTRVSFYAPPELESWLRSQTELTGESIGDVAKRRLHELMKATTPAGAPPKIEYRRHPLLIPQTTEERPQ